MREGDPDEPDQDYILMKAILQDAAERTKTQAGQSSVRDGK